MLFFDLSGKEPNKYVSGTDLYPHMPILRPHALFHEWRISSMTVLLAHFYCNVNMWVSVARTQAVCPILGFWGRKVHKNVRFPALDAYEPLSKI